MNCQWKNCNEVFVTSLELKTHIDCLHLDDGRIFDESGKQAFLCQWRGCSKIGHHFGHRYRLLRHVSGVHCKQKSFKCSECQKSFAYYEGLRDHLRIHTGEKPYKCRVPGCEMTFRTSSDRVKHQKTHQFVQHDCPTCNYFCHTKVTLARHHKRVHGQKLPQKYEKFELKAKKAASVTSNSPILVPQMVPEVRPPVHSYQNHVFNQWPLCYTYQYYPSDQLVPQGDEVPVDYSVYLSHL